MKIDINESKFSMWRATLFLVNVDGKVTPEEEKWLEDYLLKASFNPEQSDIIQSDLKNGIESFSDLYDKITHPPDRATLLHFANMIFKRDGEFHPLEEEFLNNLRDNVLNKVDIDAALQKIADVDKTERDLKESYTKINESN